MDLLILAGVIFILLGFGMVFAGALTQAKEGGSKIKIAGGGFIGPIPFGFANDKAMFYVVVGLLAFFFVLWIFFNHWPR